MKKILALGLSLLFISSPLNADVTILNNGVKQGTAIILNCGPDGSMTCACEGKRCTIIANGGGGGGLALLPSLQAAGNLVFFKDFATGQTTVDADYSVGSPTGTFAATRSASAPATVIDATGLITTVTTSDTPRWTQGFYDSTGFHLYPGLIMEQASTNLVPKSTTLADATWTISNATDMTANNTDAGSSSPDGTATAPSLTDNAVGNSTFILTTNVTARTYSVWLKRKTGTGDVQITSNSGSTWTTVPVTTSWARFLSTSTSAGQKCGIKIVTASDAVYVWGNQFESAPFATSYIPTATAARTRAVETLSYPITGNRSGDTESIFIRYYLNWPYNSTSGSVTHLAYDNDSNGGGTTDRRYLTATTGSNYSVFAHDTTDTLSKSTGLAVEDNYTIQNNSLPNTTWSIFNNAGPTYIQTYSNGFARGTNQKVTTFATPAFGANWYLGNSSSVGATTSLNATFQKVAIYSNALTKPVSESVYRNLTPTYFMGVNGTTPVLTDSGTGFLPENVVYDSATSKYWMIFEDRSAASAVVRLASSTSMTGTWTAEATASISIPGQDAGAPFLVHSGASWYIFYSDTTDHNLYLAKSSTVNGTYSTAGITNPILSKGAGGTWNENRVLEPCVELVGATWQMLYMGETAGTLLEKTGHATASNIEGPWTDDAANNPVIAGGTAAYNSGQDSGADPFIFKYNGVYYVGSTVTNSGKDNWKTMIYTTTDFVNFTTLVTDGKDRQPALRGYQADGTAASDYIATFRGQIYQDPNNTNNLYWIYAGKDNSSKYHAMIGRAYTNL